MSKLLSEVLYWLMTLSLGWMIYTNNYTYLNIIDVVYSLLLVVTTVCVPLIFIVFSIRHPSLEESFDKCKDSLCNKGLVSAIWSYLKSLLSIVVLAMSGHTFILSWYILCTIMCIGFANWLSTTKTYS